MANIFQEQITAEKPKSLAEQRVYVYVPRATSSTPGIASYDSNDFILNNGKVFLRQNNPSDRPSLILFNSNSSVSGLAYDGTTKQTSVKIKTINGASLLGNGNIVLTTPESLENRLTEYDKNVLHKTGNETSTGIKSFDGISAKVITSPYSISSVDGTYYTNDNVFIEGKKVAIKEEVQRVQNNLDSLSSKVVTVDTTKLVNYYLKDDVYSKNETYSKTEIDTKTSRVYVAKGSVQTYDDLPVSGNNVGDVYNVIEATPTHPAGTNYVWTEEGYWDALGGAIDTSNLVDLSSVQTITGQKTFSGNQTFSGSVAILNKDSNLRPYISFGGDSRNRIAKGDNYVFHSFVNNTEYELSTPIKNGTLAVTTDIDTAKTELQAQIDSINTQIGDIGTLLDTINGEAV